MSTIETVNDLEKRYKKHRRWKTLFEVVEFIAESRNNLFTGDINYDRKVII